jgi:ABC-type Zn uptake system ZnuABC Zn-binding protein ZnuA
MKKINTVLILFIVSLQALFAQEPLRIVTTLSTYADIAKNIGGDKVDVQYIVPGNQDAHFVRPKPSYAVILNKADIFISTGLDLELWAPTLVDMSKNPKIRSGQVGYIAASAGIELLDIPDILSRSEGGLHIYGNPHIITSPLNFAVIAENITVGLENNDPKNSSYYRENLKSFKDQLYQHIFGKELIDLLGGDLLSKLTLNGNLIDFLSSKSYKNKKLIDFLGGWMKAGMIFRNKKIVCYHKNWIYFEKMFGITVIGYVEPKPGIPPSPKHVEELVQDMKKNNIRVLMAANYFSEPKVEEICEKVGAIPVMVPMGVGGASGTDNVFMLVDYWIEHLKNAFEKIAGI